MLLEYLPQILTFILSVLGTGVISSFYYRKQNLKKKELNNDNIVIQQMQAVIDRYVNLVEDYKNENIQLHERINKIEEDKAKENESIRKFWKSEVDEVRSSSKLKTQKIDILTEENKALMEKLDSANSEIAELRVTKCIVKRCTKRMPPSNY